VNDTIILGDGMNIIKWFYSYLKKYKLDVYKTTFFMFLESLVELLIPVIMALLINNGIANKDIKYIIFLSIILLILLVFGIIGSILNGYLSSKISAYVSYDLREDLFSSICDRRYKELDNINISKCITIFSSDITTVGTVVLYFVRLFLKIILIFIFSIILSSFISLKLFIIILIVIPICLLLFIIIFKKAFPYFDLTQDSLDNLNLNVRENIAGIRLVKTLRQEKFEINKFKKSNNILKNINIKSMKLVTLTGPILQFFIYLATFLIILYSNHLLNNNLIKIGSIMAFLQYLTMILSSLLSGSMILLLVLKSWVSLKRIYKIINIENDITLEKEILNDINNIEFNNISFSYNKNTTKKILNNISFKIKKGEHVSIIGRCGSGKSTLLKLISNFYEAESGNILINGKNINLYSDKDIKKNILYINQNSKLFSGTIKSNIEFYKKNKNLNKILKISRVNDILKYKPKGLSTKVEAFGNNFSGGEKNRIILARGLFRNPQVLLLDDTLNAVDVKTEKEIWKSIKKNYSNLTIIEVNSRLSHLEDVDKIILLEDGNIEAIGNFNEIKENKLFKEFYRLQKENS